MAVDVTIIEYQPEHHDAFRSMNVEWLEKYNLMESHDMLVLDNPQATILDRGGFIWIAVADDMPVGSAALMKEKEEGVYELAKMAVIPSFQGKGISTMLMNKCLEKARELEAKKLLLFSNHQLETAIGLYSKFGFQHVEVTHSPFVTADVRMELIM